VFSVLLQPLCREGFTIFVCCVVKKKEGVTVTNLKKLRFRNFTGRTLRTANKCTAAGAAAGAAAVAAAAAAAAAAATRKQQEKDQSHENIVLFSQSSARCDL
jgi:mevalonate pyrophosphate decarboxylase